MEITIPRPLENDIMNFVKLNEIKDINGFLSNCLRDGFNIAKYGYSPKDNFEKENKPFKIEKNDTEEVELTAVEGDEKPKSKRRPKKQQSEEKESIIQKQEEVVKPKKTIKIIRN